MSLMAAAGEGCSCGLAVRSEAKEQDTWVGPLDQSVIAR